MLKRSWLVVGLLTVGLLMGGAALLSGLSFSQEKPVHIAFFPGGAPGDPFASVVFKGAKTAEEILGNRVRVTYFWSDWDPEKMVTQFKEALGLRPDGIAMMGHPGFDALKDLVDEAFREGIVVTFQNVDIPEFREQYGPQGTGYVGQIQYEAGQNIAKWALQHLSLKAGDRAAVISGSWEQPARALRARGAFDALEEAGLVVDKVSHDPACYVDVSLCIPVITGYLASHPDAKLLVLDGGGTTSATATYLQAAGKQPGEVFAVGFDLSPTTVEAIEGGWLQATVDQQPFLQGFLPIMNLYLTIKWKFSGLFIETSGAIITQQNVGPLKDLIAQGIR